jgi:hypothetical protein
MSMGIDLVSLDDDTLNFLVNRELDAMAFD